MRDDVRVRRDWIDVRHEYLQNDGRWMAGMCAKPGFCRECNRDGEYPPLSFINDAWQAGIAPEKVARTIVAAHLRIPVKLADDEAAIRATPFRRLSIAFDLQRGLGVEIDDHAILAAHSIRDIISLACEEVA